MSTEGFMASNSTSTEGRFKRVYEQQMGEVTIRYELQPLSPAEEKGLDQTDKAHFFERLVSLHVYTPRLGTPYDLLALISPHKYPILVSRERIRRYQHVSRDGATRYITCPPLETEADIGVLFHEAGHAAQLIDPATRPLFSYYHQGFEEYLIKKDVADKLSFFDAAFDIIDRVPALEQHRRGLKRAHRREQAINVLYRKKREQEDRVSNLSDEITLENINIKKRIRAHFTPYIPTIERIIKTYRLEEKQTEPLSHEVLRTLTQQLAPYGIRFPKGSISVYQLFLFLRWLMRDPSASNALIMEISDYGEPPEAFTCSFYHKQHNQDAILLDVSPKSIPFQNTFPEYDAPRHEIITILDQQPEELKKLKQLEAALQAVPRTHSSALKEVLNYPKKAMERDATWRALLWFRYLKDVHGIDFLKDSLNEQSGALHQLLKALDTYNACMIRTDKIYNAIPKR